ncbi:hypothetical protein A2U01_0065422, partial [Trifolium medium]|nr:hypothetical protein [Trifolium medium]
GSDWLGYYTRSPVLAERPELGDILVMVANPRQGSLSDHDRICCIFDVVL